MSKRPTIGDFRSTPNNPPRTPTPAPEVPAAPPPPAAPAELDDAVVEHATRVMAEAKALVEAEPVKLTPAEEYEKRLKLAGVDMAYANTVIDSVLARGYFEEYVHLRGKRITFRTRTYEDHLRLQTALETLKPELAISQDDLVTRYNLAASLVEWNGVTFRHETEEDFQKVLTALKRLPQPVYTMLARELSRFDGKMLLVFSDGAPDSF